MQHGLPRSLGPPAVSAEQASNTAASFATNTDWQSCSCEATMGHRVQMDEYTSHTACSFPPRA
ncbi:potassium-transporting ATPase subunit KdpA [Streptomyces chiangmaiensis]|uniref:Potassium-transporting ATPase subunit KdpA n=1 Tax=Streptomyces chiangmaiensis TaxID=766497 RepID=A0ABU7FWG3_9ACTN|nr:potassium-transporting ATPase subunit KdpA [Streptomyces chiangmaiensis]MED7828286.1 potassium-transporting ATPase subunit KdpA [Streptomyces chiangmaiensis]